MTSAPTLAEALAAAETVLPGTPPVGYQDPLDAEPDPRWQAVIAVADFIETDPEEVWAFAKRWGGYPHDEDLRMAIATCILEHLLEYHFERIFPRAREVALADPAFGYTVRACWKFGQTKEPANEARFDALIAELEEQGGSSSTSTGE